MPATRQLAAIMFTDIVGYTSLMGSDEQQAFAVLNQNRQLHTSIIEQNNGRLIKELGDGMMASFTTVTEAVNAAIKLQEACLQSGDFQLRIGIHLGEVVFENGDVFGDGVNIASRIQSAAKPGSIFISETVNNNVANKKEIQTGFIREESLKHVKEPVRIYEILYTKEIPALLHHTAANMQRNSIAVLPFTNMSSDPEQEYFSDGISEEIINMLAQVPGLKVAGRTSSFSFKGKNIDLRVIGEQLNVNHILEGSVRKSGNRLRITAQLINVGDGYHLWSEKYDRDLKDIFDIQDEISLAILHAIKIKLFASEKEAVLKRYTNNTEAFQFYLQGRFHYNQWSGATGYFRAIEYYRKALEIEPEYVLAYTGLAACYLNLWFFNHLSPEEGLSQMKAATVRSLQLDDGIAESHVSLARMKFWYEWDFKGADEEFNRAIDLNPNHAEAHEQYGMFLGITGRKKEALVQAGIARELEPFSLMNNWGIGWISWMTGDFPQMRLQGEKLLELEANFYGGHLILGTENWTNGKPDDATNDLNQAVRLNKGSFTLSWLGCLLGSTGNKEKALQILHELQHASVKEPIGNFNTAILYAGLGEKELAISFFEKGIEEHEGMMVFLKHWSKLVPWLDEDSRIQVLYRKIGLT